MVYQFVYKNSNIVCMHSCYGRVRVQGNNSCRWCHMPGFFCRGIHRMIFNRHRRYLDESDPARTDLTYGPPELDASPADRTHAESDAAGIAADRYVGAKCHHPKHRTSIKWWNPLSILALFNLVKDFVPDICHILKDFFCLHYIPLFKGLRGPSAFRPIKPRLLKKNGMAITYAMRMEHEEKTAKYNHWKERHEDASKVLTYTCQFE